MMGRALLVVGWLATAGFVAAGVVGYQVEGANQIGTHLLLGLVASLLLLFSHCWILFYLVGTGKAIKTTVAEYGLEDSLVERTREFKNRSNPWLMLALALAMATFILGGGVHVKVLPGWMHHSLFYLTLPAQIWALLVEQKVLTANEELMRDIDRRLS